MRSRAAPRYRNTLDIYSEREADGVTKPLHGPCGMVQLYHHASLWAIRQLPAVHGAFADLYGTRRLWVTTDRAHFKPPEHHAAAVAAWRDPGDVHRGLHWDVDTSEAAWPVPFALQGVVYLEDTPAELGPLRVVPGFHRGFRAWSRAAPRDRAGCTASAAAPPAEGRVGTPSAANGAREDGVMDDAAAASDADDGGLGARAVPVVGEAGDLVIWHTLLPHGPGRNVGGAPRVSAYVAMLPVDARPFSARDASVPLYQNDAGTLAFLEPPPPPPPSAEGGDGAPPPPPPAVARMSRADHVERWRARRPLLDEDPREEELARYPPGEPASAPPATLTPLGERLVGLHEWPLDDDGDVVAPLEDDPRDGAVG